jgi:hypothetical protein
LGIKIAAGFPTAAAQRIHLLWCCPLTYLNTRKGEFYMEYRNTAKTKSETMKSHCSTSIFCAVLNMFTIPKAIFSKNPQNIFQKIL